MSCPWTDEEIPDTGLLYMRVLVKWLDDEGLPEPRTFTNHEDKFGVNAMSTDWDRYCSPEETCRRSRRQSPAAYAIAQLRVGVVRDIPEQMVQHAPVWNDPEDPSDPNNQAHTNVIGPKRSAETIRSEEIRAKFIAECRELGLALAPGHGVE